MWRKKLLLLGVLSLTVLSLGAMPAGSIAISAGTEGTDALPAVTNTSPAGTTGQDRAAVELVETEATPAVIDHLNVLTIGTTFENNDRRLDGLTVAIDVRSTDGTSVLHEKQSGVGVDAGDQQSVYWVWRIPQRVPQGDYVIGVDVLGAGGQTMDSNPRAASFTVAR
ncbi:MAG: hypothetical protein EPO21_08020 [Chloroflexota bacterium]|nr:MAG: hypothetical protein EPO21_08020 [Chloroflexota bacterium]